MSGRSRVIQPNLRHTFIQTLSGVDNEALATESTYIVSSASVLYTEADERGWSQLTGPDLDFAEQKCWSQSE